MSLKPSTDRRCHLKCFIVISLSLLLLLLFSFFHYLFFFFYWSVLWIRNDNFLTLVYQISNSKEYHKFNHEPTCPDTVSQTRWESLRPCKNYYYFLSLATYFWTLTFWLSYYWCNLKKIWKKLMRIDSHIEDDPYERQHFSNWA